jgi:hypothetical protein
VRGVEAGLREGKAFGEFAIEKTCTCKDKTTICNISHLNSAEFI